MTPVAECYLSKDGTTQIVPKCPFCGQQHLHGAGEPGTPGYPLTGHRTAHCVGDEGAGGYILKLKPAPEAESGGSDG